MAKDIEAQTTVAPWQTHWLKEGIEESADEGDVHVATHEDCHLTEFPGGLQEPDDTKGEGAECYTPGQTDEEANEEGQEIVGDVLQQFNSTVMYIN